MIRILIHVIVLTKISYFPFFYQFRSCQITAPIPHLYIIHKEITECFFVRQYTFGIDFVFQNGIKTVFCVLWKKVSMRRKHCILCEKRLSCILSKFSNKNWLKCILIDTPSQGMIDTWNFLFNGIICYTVFTFITLFLTVLYLNFQRRYNWIAIIVSFPCLFGWHEMKRNEIICLSISKNCIR